MATSGITQSQLTRDDIIASAMRKIGVLQKNQTPDSSDLANGKMALNVIIAKFRALGMPLWKRSQYSFTTTTNVSTYSIGTGQTLNTPYPLHIYQAWRVDSGSSSDIDVLVESDYNFNLLPNTTGGGPIKLTYKPGNNVGTIKLWPTPENSTTTIYISYQAPFEYFNAATDNPDFPDEWNAPIIDELAVRLAPEWGVPLMDRELLRKEAKESLESVLMGGGEDASLFVQARRS